MKKKTIIILIAALAVSVIGNVFFLTVDIFNGTYYQIPTDSDLGRVVFKVNGRVVDYKRYDGDDMTQKTGYYEVTEREGQKIIDVMAFIEFGQQTPFNGLLSLHRKSVFFMTNYLNDIWYICPAAIIIQILWLAADVVLVVFLLKKLGLSRFKLQIAKKETN